MKKIIVILLVVTLSLGMFFTGCSKDTSSSEPTANDDASVVSEKVDEKEATDTKETSDEGQLNVFHRWPPESDVMAAYLVKTFDKFAADNSDIDMIVDSVPPSMYEAQLTVRLASDEAPDVFSLWPGGRAEAQVRNNTILDIRDLWEENGWFDDFTAAVVGGCEHMDGNIYTFPMDNMTNTFWYNAKIFEEAGAEVPTTWDELMEACELIKEAGYTPIALGGNPTRWMPALWFDYILLNTAGGEFRERLMWGQESWESEEVYRVFETWKTAIDAGYFNQDFGSIDANQATALITSGKAAMMLNGPWNISVFIGEDVGWVPEEDFNLFAFPSVDPNVPQASEGCITAWCISSKTDALNGAKRLLTYFGSSENIKTMAKERNSLGPRKDTGFDVYSDEMKSMMQRISDETSENPLHQNFELATLPAMQDAGMDAIIEFLTYPDTYKDICTRVEAVSQETFK